jgi:hypothetical protein
MSMAANSSAIADKFPPRAPAPGGVGRCRRLVATAWLLAFGAQAVAEDVAPHEATVLPDTIEVLTVKPAKIAPAVLMPNAQVPGAPPPIEAAQRAAWLAGQAAATEGDGAVAGAVDVPTIVLGPAMLSLADRAHLVLTRPVSVHPEATIEFASDPGGIAAVRLKVQAGETYLLDFAVSALGQGVYTLIADSGQREFDDPEGMLRHLLIGLKAEASGWTSVRLQRSGAGYHLHSVAVTGTLQERF